jgi:hypothetical protein
MTDEELEKAIRALVDEPVVGSGDKLTAILLEFLRRYKVVWQTLAR